MLLLTLLASAAAEEACAEPQSEPRIVIGCWQLLERHADESRAVDTLQAYFDAEFTAYDTADIYGRSETLLGMLRERGRAPIVYTKYVTQDASIANARAINAASRRALGAAPEMVQFHWWDFGDARFVQAAAHLATLQSEGALAQVAACNFDTAHLRELVDAGVPIRANQIQFSLLDRRPENGMLHYAREKGIRLACFGTIGGGWLSDRWLGAPRPHGRRAQRTVSMRMYHQPLERWSGGDWELFQDLLRAARKIADKHASTIANVAAAWVLRQLDTRGAGGWVIVGVRDTEHLDEHKALRALALDDDDDAALAAVLARGRSPAKDGDIWSFERGR